ncbi:MAG: hypothetical protein WD768_11780 [Phycisphaeraceae bacterium]
MLTRLCPILLFALISSATHAAPQPLPDKALGDDVVGILWIDAQKVDTAKLKASINALFGGFGKEITQGLAPWERRHASLVRAGCTSMAIIQFDPYSNNTVSKGAANPVFLFSVSDRNNVPAVEALILDATRDERGQAKCRTEMLGDWILAYDLRLAGPFMEKGKAERMDLFKAALDPISTHPAVLAFVPTARMRRNYGEKAGLNPDALREVVAFNKLLLESKYLSIAVTVGERSAVDVVLEMSSSESAEDLLRLQQPLVKALAPIAKMTSPRGIRIENIQEACNYHAVLANNKFEQRVARITGSSEGKALATTAQELAAGIIKAREEALIVRSLNQMQVLVIALNRYAAANQGVYPSRLEDLATNQYVNNLKDLLANPRTGEAVGYIYRRPTSTLQVMVKEKRIAQTPMLYEARGGRIDPAGMIAYVNEAVVRPDIRE